MVNMQHIGMLKLLLEDAKNMSNEYYEEQWKRFRKSYDVKNKYHDLVGKHTSFMDYRIEATDWNEKMLTKMHKTIRLEGRPVCTKDKK